MTIDLILRIALFLVVLGIAGSFVIAILTASITAARRDLNR